MTPCPHIQKIQVAVQFMTDIKNMSAHAFGGKSNVITSFGQVESHWTVIEYGSIFFFKITFKEFLSVFTMNFLSFEIRTIVLNHTVFTNNISNVVKAQLSNLINTSFTYLSL